MAALQPSKSSKIPTRTLVTYGILLVITVIITLFDISTNRVNQLLLSVPIALMLLIAIITDREVAHVPPLIIVATIAAMVLAVLSAILQFHTLLAILSSVLIGVSLMMMGLVFVYTILHSAPGNQKVSRLSINIFALSIAMAVLLLMFLVQLVYNNMTGNPGFDTWDATMDILFSLLGCFLTAILSELGLDKLLMENSINKMMESYFPQEYSNELAREGILEIIKSGESEILEFKSTICTNLLTKEVDKRMEKAVLKSMVAFMNTSGGILLIGVTDSGEICGVDEEQFDSKDKMYQHLSHLISSKIGDEFSPYITLRLIEMGDGKSVVRADCEKCKKPVFLKEGKNEEFYVRSGPSSIILSGSNLVNYITNKSSRQKQGIVNEAKMREYMDSMDKSP